MLRQPAEATLQALPARIVTRSVSGRLAGVARRAGIPSALTVKKILFSLFLLFLLIISLDEPMALVFALGVLGILFQERFNRWARRFSSSLWFLFFGIFFGLLTEGAAILGNIGKPEGERILIDPNPAMDLLYGFFFYGLFIGTWYLLLRRFHFSLKQVFFVSGVFGILTEQFNSAVGPVILLNIFTNPVSGIPMAFLVACIYGIFPTLAYTLTRHTFPEDRSAITTISYGIVMAAFFLQWAFYGNILLPATKSIF